MAPTSRDLGIKRRLQLLERASPASWTRTGPDARPNLHAILRYPAMMVPCMQGDILDAILPSLGPDRHILDPFVGSGTMMTEALTRGVDFRGVDINPLAVMVCEAKAAIDAGVDVELAVETVIAALRSDLLETIDVEFPNRTKWFSDESTACLSRMRRAICEVSNEGARKVMWTVFAETIRLSSNSRTSTYKLHIRPDGDRVDAVNMARNFTLGLRQTLARVREYRASPMVVGRKRTPSVSLTCGDARAVPIINKTHGHQVLVTSPPYGDNHTTIPYGQFSYLALQMIPMGDLPADFPTQLLTNTHSLDSASLGGTSRVADAKITALREVSPQFDRFAAEAALAGNTRAIGKAGGFLGDFFDALKHIHAGHSGTAHWVITTGNRTAAGMVVPFDKICRDLISSLGGVSLVILQRRLPPKRMPTKNSLGNTITVESTFVAEFV